MVNGNKAFKDNPQQRVVFDDSVIRLYKGTITIIFPNGSFVNVKAPETINIKKGILKFTNKKVTKGNLYISSDITASKGIIDLPDSINLELEKIGKQWMDNPALSILIKANYLSEHGYQEEANQLYLIHKKRFLDEDNRN